MNDELNIIGSAEVHRERAKVGARLANELAAAGAAFLAHIRTGGGIAAIPDASPPQYVVVGTLAAIGQLLQQDPGTVAVEQSTGDLPPLPEPWITNMGSKDPAAREHYARDQMEDYARAAIAAHLERQPKADKERHSAGLHNAIMNLPAIIPESCKAHDLMLAYKVGHRDARHAAAELALQSPAPSASALDIRNQALEEAAKVCENEVPCSCCFSDDEVALAGNLAEAIRALKGQTVSANSLKGDG
jgi:hypothetical protein